MRTLRRGYFRVGPNSGEGGGLRDRGPFVGWLSAATFEEMDEPVDPHLTPYLDTVERLAVLAVGADDLGQTVPTCPDWTAHDVFAHLAGLAEDWVEGRLEPYGSDEWAAAQVERLRGREIDEIVDRLRVAASQFGGLESPLGLTPARWGFSDAVTHEADLRPVLVPGTRVPPDAVSLATAGAVSRWRHHISSAGLGPMVVEAVGLRSWNVGDPGEGDLRVTAEPYELFRGLFGRRTRRQFEAWAWSGDPSEILDLGLPTPFSWADADVVD